jgi:hypothetical protein
VNWSFADVALVPLAVVTVTSICPAACAGEFRTIDVAVLLVKLELGTDVAPKLTDDAFRRLAPAIVTLVPPAVVPDAGLTLVTVGAGVNSSAPMSGVVAFRVSPSKSVVMPVIGVPALDTGDEALVAGRMCRSVVEVKSGLPAIEFASFVVAVRHAASVVWSTAVPAVVVAIAPSLPGVPLTK